MAVHICIWTTTAGLPGPYPLIPSLKFPNERDVSSGGTVRFLWGIRGAGSSFNYIPNMYLIANRDATRNPTNDRPLSGHPKWSG